MNILDYTTESFAYTHPETCAPLPALITSGCGCCSGVLPVTRENLDKAIHEAEEWLEQLRNLQPYDYPEGTFE